MDEWTDPNRHFAHLKSGDLARTRTCCCHDPADAINLGLTKMAESCPGDLRQTGVGYKPGTSATRPIRRAAELVNAHFHHPFAEHWGDGNVIVGR